MSKLSRRHVLSMLVYAGLVPAGQARMRAEIDVVLSVADEQGGAVPYATVWGYVLPLADPLAIDAEDLWRLTQRYQCSFEFVTPFNHMVPCLQVWPMGNVNGRASFAIDYEYLEGRGTRRPPSLQVGFTVMKRGYLPGRVDFALTKESRVTAKIVLKRDPATMQQAPAYLQEFDRVRYELSDTRANARISLDNYRREEQLRAALEAAARDALAANDRASAARIYARMQYLPAVRLNADGKPIGFAQSDPYSEISWEYLRRAYELDPSNPYIAAEYVFRRGSDEFGGRRYVPEQASAQRKQAFAEFLGELHSLMRSSGECIWPTYHVLYALWHRKSSDPKQREQVIPLLQKFYEFEPKFETLESLMQPIP